MKHFAESDLERNVTVVHWVNNLPYLSLRGRGANPSSKIYKSNNLENIPCGTLIIKYF